MTTHLDGAFQFGPINPLSIVNPGEKLLSRSSTVWTPCQPTRDQVFWDNYYRRQHQLSRQGFRSAPWRPYEEVGPPIYLEPKKCMLESLGPPVEEDSKTDPVPEEDVPIYTTTSDSPGANKSLTFRCLWAGKREDAVSLRKHLGNTRRLVSAVKHGRGYFLLLQKEQDWEEALQWNQKRREEWLRSQPRPPGRDTDNEPWRKKAQSARPFTPIHRSLTSHPVPESLLEPIFRQLCCLNWILEALTLDRTGRAGPITSCWDPIDPGRCRTAMKTLNRDRAIETRWEQFVSQPKPRRASRRPSRVSSGRLYSWKGSSLSVASSLALCTPTPLDSQSSNFPAGTEEQPGAAGDSETEVPVSEYLQKLLDEVHQSVTKEFSGPEQNHDNRRLTDRPSTSIQPTPQGENSPIWNKNKDSPRPKSCPAKPLSATSELIRTTRSIRWDMRTAHEERVAELAQSFSNRLDDSARKRLDFALKRFQSLGQLTYSQRVPRRAAMPVTEVKTPDTEKACFTNNVWLSSLINSLPTQVSEDRRVSQVVEKLRRFADNQTPTVRPQAFLKVLAGLQPWELCLPDLCVAIEIARENVVQMTREEYDSWLLSRVPLPKQQEHRL
ncbi:hypothetical protein DPEC_G00256920 [Dallia pectoralis]|uniref:Uncharacterized protein n=1 Tax=Dallia pectoralis TaxID=75939 RepID=A0ACC2FQT1_DALPE|nr:hypothetical protein DPEC_G00256920 [Dallia pectoralis]